MVSVPSIPCWFRSSDDVPFYLEFNEFAPLGGEFAGFY